MWINYQRILLIIYHLIYHPLHRSFQGIYSNYRWHIHLSHRWQIDPRFSDEIPPKIIILYRYWVAKVSFSGKATGMKDRGSRVPYFSVIWLTRFAQMCREYFHEERLQSSLKRCSPSTCGYKTLWRNVRGKLHSVRLTSIYASLTNIVPHFFYAGHTCGFPYQLCIPEQLSPSPVKPLSHIHIKDPWVLLQVAFPWQGSSTHSSTSTFFKRKSIKSYL